MDKTLIIVCAVVGSLGVLSSILGFSAEGTKLNVDTVLPYFDKCIYPQNPALGLGVSAAVFLLAAQVTSSAVGGCCGCCRSRAVPSESKRIIGIVCAVGSWVAAAIAWALLIEGASWNASGVRATNAAGYCYFLKDGIFAGGAVLALAATALAVTSFVMLRRQPLADAATGTPQSFSTAVDANGGNGIPVAKPQPPDGVPTGEPQGPLSQANDNGEQNGDPPQQVPTGPVPPPPPPVAQPQGNGLLKLIGREVARVAVKIVWRAVVHYCLPCNNDDTATPIQTAGEILDPGLRDP